MAKHVVIVGGGIGGLSLVKILEKDASVSVTLVEPKDFFLVKYGALRAASQAGKWADGVALPIAKVLKRTVHKQAHVTSIDRANKSIKLNNGETVSYDVLVVCTGGRNFSPGEPPVNITSAIDAKAYWEGIKQTLSTAKSVAIMGTGPVAVEFAGEVRIAHPQASVTILAGSHKFMSKVVPNFKEASLLRIRKTLTDMNIQVAEGDEVVKPLSPAKQTLVNADPVLRDVTVEFKSGKTQHFDAVIFTLGGQLRNSMFAPSTWLDPTTGEIVIDDFFRVAGELNVFAFGDSAKTGRAKAGVWASDDAKTVAANVKAVLSGKMPTKKLVKAKQPFIVLPVGDKKGISILGWLTLGNGFTSAIKGKDLFLGMVWKTFAGVKAPL